MNHRGHREKNGEGFSSCLKILCVLCGRYFFVLLLVSLLIAPIAAVQHGRAHVKSEDGEETWKDVAAGVWDEKNIEIKSGLKEGDELAGEK